MVLGTKHTRQHTTKTRKSRTPSAADSSKRCLTLSREKGICSPIGRHELIAQSNTRRGLSVSTPRHRFASAGGLCGNSENGCDILANEVRIARIRAV